MKDNQLIKLIRDSQNSEDRKQYLFDHIKQLIEPKSDITYLWNKAVELVYDNKINIFEMNYIWGALTTMVEEDYYMVAEEKQNLEIEL